MSQTFEFYDSRAREAAIEAQEAVLDNVRERSLRAEKTWRGLAEQARKVKIDRAIPNINTPADLSAISGKA